MANIFYPEKTPEMHFATPSKPTHQECIKYFISFLQQFDLFSNTDFKEIIPVLEYAHWRKNESIFVADKVYTYMNFIVTGAFEFYSENEEGRSVIGFLTECNFCSPIQSFYTRQPSSEGVICMEECYGIRISIDNFMSMMQHSEFKLFFRQLNQDLLYYYAQRLKAFQSADARQRYDMLLKENPSIFQRFPLQNIARFLGIQPETLSRIRNEKRKN